MYQLTNFSYSRQNLLSNKTFQNTASNNSTIEWPEIASLKLNPTQRDSSEETTPRHRRLKGGPQQRASNTVPPDVLNVNQIQKIGTDFSQFLVADRNENEEAGFVSVGFNETASNDSNSSAEYEYKETERNRNEWREEASNEQLPR